MAPIGAAADVTEAAIAVFLFHLHIREAVIAFDEDDLGLLQVQSNGPASMPALQGLHGCLTQFCHDYQLHCTKSGVFVGFGARPVVFLQLHNGGGFRGPRAKGLADVLFSC